MARDRGRGDAEHSEKQESAAAPEDKRARLGEVLRRAYDEAVAEPVPDALADLLRKLD